MPDELQTKEMNLGYRKENNVMKKLVSVIMTLLQLLAFCSIPAQSEGYSFRKDYDAIDQAAKSVFYVEMYDRYDQCFGSASGFIAFDEHLFVTNEHVVDGASYIKVWDEDNKMYFVDKLIAVDKVHDIALLLFPEGKQYASLQLDNSNDLKPGQPVLAIGSPKGFQGTVSIGRINALTEVELYEGAICIQHTAPSSPGSSGGCLFADNGKVIGITSAGSSGEQVLNIAVPIHYVKELYDDWNKHDYKALDSEYYRNDDSSVITGVKNKTDFAEVTGGNIETFVAIPEETDLHDYFYPMEAMTVSEFLNEYDRTRKIAVKTAPAITDRSIIKPFVWSDEHCIRFDLSRGIGSTIYFIPGNNGSLEVPITGIVIKCNNSTKANAKACVSVFTGDPEFFDVISLIYEGNACEQKNLYAAYLTKEGYLFLYSGNDNGDRTLEIRYVVPY